MSVAMDHRGPWTLEDVLALPDDGSHTRHELIAGTLIVSPSPTYPHQRVAYRLGSVLRQAAEAAGADVEVFESVNVTTPSGLLIPDIAVVDGAAARDAGLTLPGSAMVAVVEIVSAFSRRIDRLVKPGLYAEAGVPAYWRVETEPALALSAYVLRDGTYREVAAGRPGMPVEISMPFPVCLDVSALAAG
jgi:Uma2 family endonuclease